MNQNQTPIDAGTVIVKVVEILILKVFTLPFHIYKSALIALSSSKSEDREEAQLSTDLPLLIWILSVFNAVIIVSWPLGIIGVLYLSIDFSLWPLITGLLAVYFLPLLYSIVRESLLVSLKIVLYLKLISKRNSGL